MYWWYDWTMILLIPPIIISLWAQMRVNGTFKRYSQVRAGSGLTGAQVAQRILNDHQIQGVRIELVRGSLTDHYDPRRNVVNLSESVYHSTSLAALGVAAHEIGHVIQHETGYTPLRVRTALVPLAQIGSYGAWIILIVGIVLSSLSLTKLGIVLFFCVVLFQLVTLPVEFNASSRALAALEGGGYLTSDETGGSKKVLNAAALTYVAAVLMAVAQLIRFILISGILRRD